MDMELLETITILLLAINTLLHSININRLRKTVYEQGDYILTLQKAVLGMQDEKTIKKLKEKLDKDKKKEK
jgi:hypothetical protein